MILHMSSIIYGLYIIYDYAKFCQLFLVKGGAKISKLRGHLLSGHHINSGGLLLNKTPIRDMINYKIKILSQFNLILKG